MPENTLTCNAYGNNKDIKIIFWRKIIIVVNTGFDCQSLSDNFLVIYICNRVESSLPLLTDSAKNERDYSSTGQKLETRYLLEL